jgi:hypothetical protein
MKRFNPRVRRHGLFLPRAHEKKIPKRGQILNEMLHNSTLVTAEKKAKVTLPQLRFMQDQDDERIKD